MTNKYRLQENNANLDGYIARVNAAKDVAATLPEAGGGGSVGKFTKYAKLIATPASTTSFVITNPLGGKAKLVFVTRLADDKPSSRKIQQYIADLDFRMGVLYAVASSGSARYTVTAVDSGVNNGNFMMTDGAITLYRYNSANTWDVNSEYEVEIYE